MVITALTEGVVELIKDLNGNHVVQRCLQKLSHEDSQVRVCVCVCFGFLCDKVMIINRKLCVTVRTISFM
jgi:hypothetical protein